ncbi:MAG: DNA polymerase III subunit gamma/tau [Treponemataceae bacterium]|nr:DNA polymerase III subunit gamma/tau [Treponemataceae bacterium]
MAYEVTATRRRPKTFDDLVGQEFVASTLRNSIKDGKIAHAYLFSGPRGCGKTSTARILAKVLNCEKGPEHAPCGECTACKEIARGASMDVIEIDGASNTSVNDVRQIKDEVLFPPNSCKYKIYIIDEVHMLSMSAFNALLKTIEEPPPYVIFIFATTELHKVPATIKSRCQQFHFRLGSVDQIKDLLKKAADEVGLKADDEALYWIARESTGSFRDAYTLFDQVAAFSDGHITYEGIRDKLGLVGAERLNELCELCCDGKSGAALEKIDSLLQAGVSVEQLITNISDYLRSLLLIQSGITKESLLGQNKDRFSAKVLATWDSIRLERAISLFLQLFRDHRYSLNPRYELELAISRLCWLKDYVSAREVKLAIDKARGLLSGTQPINPQVSSNAAANIATQTAPQKKLPFQFSFNTEAPTSTDSDAEEAYPWRQDKPAQAQTPPIQPNPARQEDIWTPPAPQRPTGENQGPFPESGTIEKQVAETTDTAANPDLPLDELKAKIISETEFSKAFLAVSLKSTGEWYLSEDKIIIPVPTAYLKIQIDSESRTLAMLTSKFKGPSFKVMTELEQQKNESKKNLPPEVENLCNLFNGTVVDINTSVETNASMNTSQETDIREFGSQSSQYFYEEEEGDQDEF